jgi:hypothetical protein
MDRSQATKSNCTILKYMTIKIMMIVKYYRNCRHLNYIVATVCTFYQYTNILDNCIPTFVKVGEFQHVMGIGLTYLQMRK